MFPIYHPMMKHVLGSGFTETNKRTGQVIRMLPYPVGMLVDLRHGRLPVPGIRRVYPRTAAVDLAWCILGERTLDFLHSQNVRIWDKFVETDNLLAKSHEAVERGEVSAYVDSAYGYRWRHHFGRDQLRLAIEALLDDPSNRRVYVSNWDPGADGLTRKGQKAAPCPVGFTFSIVDGHLNSALMIRSSDMFVGLPYDVMTHALMMDAVAKSVNAKGLGWMHVTLAHPHFYETQRTQLQAAMSSQPRFDRPKLPGWSVSEIEHAPADYVARVAQLARDVRWAEYNEKIDVVQ